MNKKLICGLLSAAVLAGTSPITVLAADEPLSQLNDGIDLRNQETDIPDTGMGWEWDADDLMLTLNGFRVTVPVFEMDDEPLFHLPDDSTIVIDGDNNRIETDSNHADVFHCEGKLLICGSGKLEIVTRSFGTNAIYCKGGPLTIEDSVEIEVDPEGKVIFIERAKGSRPIISVLDDAKITYPKEDADIRSILISHTTNVTPSDNWVNFSLDYDESDEMIIMTAKTTEIKPEEETPAAPEEPAKDIYQITIDSPAIVKNGDVSYTADVSPYLKNGYTMLPLRALLAVSNPDQQVHWNNGAKCAQTFVNNKLVMVTPGESTYMKVTEEIELSTPAETKNGRLFVSLRDWMNIMEIEGSQLDWNPETKTVTLTY